MFYEMMFVICMVKPALDAMRVANGDTQDVNAMVGPQTELVFTKCVEMFAESIPSSVLQMYALLGSDNVSAIAVGSIVSSAMAISFASTTMSVDTDCDPSKRLLAPKSYGYVPDMNRLLVFLVMAMTTTFQVLMKLLACSLMLRWSILWFFLYAGGDMSLYFLYKIVRGDLRYWFSLPNAMSWITSFIVRMAVKTICYFTLVVHFRHPFELGGRYRSLNMIANQLLCFVSVYLYTRFFVDYRNEYIEEAQNNATSNTNANILCNATGNTMNTACAQAATESTLWFLVISLFVLSMLGFYIFSRLINEEYLWTFYDTRTGS